MDPQNKTRPKNLKTGAHHMTKARTRGAKARAKHRRRISLALGQSVDLPPLRKPPEPPADQVALEARIRHGIPADRANSPMAGCWAGRVILNARLPAAEESDLWQAVQHIRRVKAAWWYSIGAPKPDAQCLRILAPTDALATSADAPAFDDRSEQERAIAADRENRALEAWVAPLGRVGAEIIDLAISGQAQPLGEASRAAFLGGLRLVAAKMRGK